VQVIADPADFFARLGGLHDCTILAATFEVAGQRLVLSIDDLNWNFEGLPEYPGPRPAKLVFVNASATDALATGLVEAWVWELLVVPADGRFTASLFENSGEGKTAEWTFASLQIDEPESSRP